MAIFVLVHGGGHGGWCYLPVTRRLQQLGHIVYTPSLSGLGEHHHQMHAGIDLKTHIEDVVNLLFMEDLRDVIIVGHSYGGMVITGVADRSSDRVAHRVYLDAAYPENGQSLVDHTRGSINRTREAAQVINGVELVLFPGKDPMHFYGVTDPEMIEWMKPRLTPQPWIAFEQKLVLQNEEAMRAIPESHIICTSTIQGRDIATLQQRSEGRVWDVDCGHDLMLIEPQWVTERLCDVAATQG